MDFWISDWISGFHSGFLDFSLDFWISVWISADGVRDFFRDGPLGPNHLLECVETVNGGLYPYGHGSINGITLRCA